MVTQILAAQSTATTQQQQQQQQAAESPGSLLELQTLVSHNRPIDPDSAVQQDLQVIQMKIRV